MEKNLTTEEEKKGTFENKENLNIEQKQKQTINNEVKNKQKTIERNVRNIPNQLSKAQESEILKIKKLYEKEFNKKKQKKNISNSENSIASKYKEDESKNNKRHILPCCLACCFLIFAICCAIITLLIELFLIILYYFMFLYFKNNYNECKAELYTELDTIINICMVLFAILVIVSMMGATIKCCEDNCGNTIFGLFFCFYYILMIATSALEITLLIIVQKYYNKTKSWEKCGNFKKWAKIWLIINYISLVLKGFKAILGNCKSENT